MLGDLSAAILAAERASRHVSARVQPFADDPFRLDLPELPVADLVDIDGPTLELLGGLYLIAQLEQTGMLRAAELLIEHRMSLELSSYAAAALLDDLADDRAQWYDRGERQELYARVFGVGPAAASGPVTNGRFEATLLELASAIARWSEAVQLDRRPIAGYSGAVAHAVGALRANLAPRQHGNTVAAAHRLAAQVRASHLVLTHDGVIDLVTGLSMWDVVRSMWEGAAPDIDRLVTLGQSGQHLIGWVGSPVADLGEPTPLAVEAAAAWLQALDGGAAA